MSLDLVHWLYLWKYLILGNDCLMILLKGDLLLIGRGYGPNVMFSDGENIGHVAASKDVSEFQFTQMQDKYIYR